jgi:hypothetical protein
VDREVARRWPAGPARARLRLLQAAPEGPDPRRSRGALGKLPRTGGIERAEERQAEAKRAAEEQRRPLVQVGEALIAAKRAAGRKPSTIEAYSYWLRIRIVDFFGPTPVGGITRDDVRAFAAALERKGLAPKSRANALGTLHSLIEFAIDEGWMVGENPVKRVEKPALAETDPDATTWRPKRSKRCCERFPTIRSAGSSA